MPPEAPSAELAALRAPNHKGLSLQWTFLIRDLLTRMTLGPEHSSLLVDPHDMR
jgi:hypothetical protein